MSTVALVWTLVGVVATLVLGIVVAALVRQVLLVGRTAMRLAEEARTISSGIDGLGRGRGARR